MRGILLLLILILCSSCASKKKQSEKKENIDEKLFYGAHYGARNLHASGSELVSHTFVTLKASMADVQSGD